MSDKTVKEMVLSRYPFEWLEDDKNWCEECEGVMRGEYRNREDGRCSLCVNGVSK